MLAAFAILAILLVALDASTGVPLHTLTPPVSAPPVQPTAAPPAVATPAAPPLPSGATVSASAVAAAATRPSTPATTGPAGPTATAVEASPTVTPAAVSTATATDRATDMAGTATGSAATDSATAITAVATASATASVTASVTATTGGTPTTGLSGATPASVTATDRTPPHYGLYYAYTNNTAFTPDYLHVLSERIIALTNDQRASDNLAPLTENDRLDIIAAARSEDMIQRHYFDHYDPTGPPDGSGRHAAAVVELLARNGIPYAEVGENLIDRSGYALDNGTPRQVVTAWMNHPEHRDNILQGAYTRVGVGIATSLGPDGLRVVVTQVFLH